MNEDQERRLREILNREPRPELSPFFSARVMHQVRGQTGVRETTPLALQLYWWIGLTAAIFGLLNLDPKLNLEPLILALVPLGFAGWLYRDKFVPGILMVLAPLFGGDRRG